jgi:hypothetical protein
MANIIGSMIGVIDHTFKTKLDNGDVVTLAIKFDFASASDDEIKSWLVSNRVIAFQRPIRTLTAAEAKKLTGSTVDASGCGKKIASEEETFKAGIKALRAMNQNDIADKLEAERAAKMTKSEKSDN